MLSHCSHVNQHQSTLDPWYLKFSSYLNHGQTKTAKGKGKKEVRPGTKQGQPGRTQGQQGTKKGQPGTKQGQSGTKKGQGHNWTNADNFNTFTF